MNKIIHFLPFSSLNSMWAHILSLFNFFSTTTFFLLLTFFFCSVFGVPLSFSHAYFVILALLLCVSGYSCYISKSVLNVLMRSFKPLISCNCGSQSKWITFWVLEKSDCSLLELLVIGWFGFLSKPKFPSLNFERNLGGKCLLFLRVTHMTANFMWMTLFC